MNYWVKMKFYYRIIDGFEALDDLEKMPVNPKTFRPLNEARITSVTIHANPLAGWNAFLSPYEAITLN